MVKGCAFDIHMVGCFPQIMVFERCKRGCTWYLMEKKKESGNNERSTGR